MKIKHMLSRDGTTTIDPIAMTSLNVNSNNTGKHSKELIITLSGGQTLNIVVFNEEAERVEKEYDSYFPNTSQQ